MTLPENWIKPLARAGYASRGVIYLVVGSFALLAARGAGEKKDTQGALQEIFQQPLGSVMTGVLIAGLVGFVIWRLIQAIADTDDHGWSLRGLSVRVGLLASAATYGLLTIYALALLGVFARPHEEGSSTPVADFFAGIVGVKAVIICLAAVFAGIAIAHWWKALTRRYADHFVADDRAMTFIHPVSMLGLIARGAVFAIISVLLMYRFTTVEPTDGSPPGIKDAMSFLQGLPFGAWLLTFLGAGLVLFAGYSFIEAVWRRINVEDA